jgi:poly(hydroxyalkanoate) granule-associated protein
MFETLDKVMFAGLGALSMTRQRAEEIFEECVKRGQAVQQDKSRFVKDLMDSAEKTRADLEKMISEQVHKAAGKLHVANQQDVQRIEQKLDQILQKLG